MRTRDAVEPLVELVDFGPLLPQPAGVQPVDHRHPLRVVGDGDVLQPALLGGGGHLLDRGRAVGPRAVHVQVAADVAQLDQLGQLAGVGPIELAPGLAQLGRETGQVQRAVDLLFRAAGDLLLAAEDAVFVDLQPPRLGPAAEHDVVLLRAGEVLQGRAERLGRHGPQIDLHAGRASGATFSCRRGR